MSIIEKKPAQPNQSIIDALTMLQAVVGADGPVGCTQLARQYGLDVTRVNRILGTLAYVGMLKRTRSRKYLPGAGVHVLATMGLGRSDLIGCSLPHVKALERKTKMIGTIGVLWRTRVSFIHFGAPGQVGTVAYSGSSLLPAHHAAVGRVLLAQYPNDVVRDQYRAFGGEEKVNLRDLARVLSRVRANGYAKGEALNSIAVGIGEPAVAGLGLMPRGKEKRPFKEADIPRLVERLHEAADKIAADMSARKAR